MRREPSAAERHYRTARIKVLAERARVMEGPGTNRGMGWGDETFTYREPVAATDSRGSIRISSGGYRVNPKPGAE